MIPDHPLAAIFPLLEGEDFAKLVRSIATSGLKVPITLYEDKVLDGRNRYRACIEAGADPRFVEYAGDSPLADVIAWNLERRHLNATQRAAVAIDVLPLFEEEAKKRKAAATAKATQTRSRVAELRREGIEGRDGAYLKARILSDEARRLEKERYIYFLKADQKIKIGISVWPPDRLKEIQNHQPQACLLGFIPGNHALEQHLHSRFAYCRSSGEWFSAEEIEEEVLTLISLCEIVHTTEAKRATAEAGAAFGANYRYVSDLKAIREQSPELFEECKKGEKTVPDAKRELNREEHARKVELAQASPKALRSESHSIILADPPWRHEFISSPSRRNENHYQTATLEEIASHRPKSAAQDSILFLWAVAPLLPEALSVMASWGFLYRTHAIWDKQKIGMGFWFRGQHEVLLVGIKGKPGTVPECARRPSVFSEPRGEHSAKPQCVYEWIEAAFPLEPKLEMYARAARTGWDAWGNEV